MSNILVLAREDAGAQKIFESGGVEKLDKMLDSKDKDLRLNTIRALACMAKHSKLRVMWNMDFVWIFKCQHHLDPLDIYSTVFFLSLFLWIFRAWISVFSELVGSEWDCSGCSHLFLYLPKLQKNAQFITVKFWMLMSDMFMLYVGLSTCSLFRCIDLAFSVMLALD